MDSLVIQQKSISELNPAAYNPRKDLQPGDSEYEKLLRSVEEFGYVEPIIWNERTGNIVGGHQRFKVMKQLGAEYIDCVVVDMDSEREKALNIALNKISGEFDLPKLTEILQELKLSGIGYTITGFDDKEVDKLSQKMARLGGQIEEDNFDVDKATEEAEAEPLTKPGDIWILGKHRLMCGDSTDIGSVAKLMDGRKAHMIFTDPPWNVNYGGTEHPSWKRRNIKNDNMSKADFGEFLRTVFKSAASVCLPGAMLYCVMSAQEWGNLHLALEDSGVHWSSTIIWYKDSLVLSRKDYHTQFEPIFYGWLNGDKRLCPLEDRQQSDVWQFDRPKKSDEHPTMKPIALVGRAITNSSRKEDAVLDMFGGSGTTILACEQTERVGYSMELDCVYCDVIVKRYIAQAKSDAGVFLIRDGNKTAYHEI